MKYLFLLLFFSLNVLADATRKELIPFSGNEQVELYWHAPRGKGPFPVFIYCYPFQGNYRGGADPYLKYGILPQIAKNGFVGAIFSQSGHGGSSGSPDHAGKNSREGMKAVIRYLKSLPIVDPEKIIVQGISMGATLSALVAAEIPDISVLILESGAYDTEGMMTRLIHRSFSDPEKKENFEHLDKHTGNEPDRYLTRSVLPVAGKIKSSTLILSGAGDTMGTVSEAIKLHELIPGSTLRIYPFAGHEIPEEMKIPDIKIFLAEQLKK